MVDGAYETLLLAVVRAEMGVVPDTRVELKSATKIGHRKGAVEVDPLPGVSRPSGPAESHNVTLTSQLLLQRPQVLTDHRLGQPTERLALIGAGPHGVRVKRIAPETIQTERKRQQIPADVQGKLAEEYPQRRLGRPEDVAEGRSFSHPRRPELCLGRPQSQALCRSYESASARHVFRLNRMAPR